MISLRVLGCEGHQTLSREEIKGRHVRKGTHTYKYTEIVYICQYICINYIEIYTYNFWLYRIHDFMEDFV